ncbi:MAG: phosphoenolpyruvate carboxylase [Gammaproteobacteria bacterium]|nr:phosphoenolpyruvate carboxylase [Gammaproteobacteria bacterium]
MQLLAELRIEPVFNAHPTESARRTILRKQQRIAEMLLGRLDPTLTPGEARSMWQRVRLELTTSWQTEDHPRERLTVADEREHVLFYLSEILYRILPTFYEEIALSLERLYGAAPETIRTFRSSCASRIMVGGDMDVHPEVHAKTIRETLLRHQQVILNAYFLECQELAQKLSQSASRAGVLPALTQRIEQYVTLLPGTRSLTPPRHDRMPYRVFLGQIAERLRGDL